MFAIVIVADDRFSEPSLETLVQPLEWQWIITFFLEHWMTPCVLLDPIDASFTKEVRAGRFREHSHGGGRRPGGEDFLEGFFDAILWAPDKMHLRTEETWKMSPKNGGHRGVNPTALSDSLFSPHTLGDQVPMFGRCDPLKLGIWIWVFRWWNPQENAFQIEI